MGVQWFCMEGVVWVFNGFVWKVLCGCSMVLYGRCCVGVQWFCMEGVVWVFNGFVWKELFLECCFSGLY